MFSQKPKEEESSSEEIQDSNLVLVDQKTEIHLAQDRKLERRTVYSASYSLKPQLFFNDSLVLCEFKNITFSGACIEIKSKLPPLTNKQNSLRLNIKQGENVFCHDINFRIAWEDRNFCHLIGVEFYKSELPYSRKNDRYFTDPNYRPTFLFRDPIEPSRNIYGTLLDISLDGFSLMTSKTNKHLFVGMRTKGTLNTIEGTLNLDTRIENLSLEEEGLRIGFSLKGNQAYTKAFKKYLATFCFEFPLDNTQMAKNIGDAITFFRVEDQEDYEKVIALRKIAYASKNKLNATSEKDLAPGLDKEGIIIGGYINGELICSVELKLKTLGHNFLVERHLDISSLPYPEESLMEINRLCIHSKAQKSDVLLTLFKKIHLFSLNNNCKNALLSTTEELKPYYLRLGAKESGMTYAHPSLPGKELMLFILDTKAYLEAETINPLLWKIVYEDNHRFAHSLGLVNEVKFGPLDKLKLIASQFIYDRAKGKKKVEEQIQEESNLQYTRSDFSTQIINPYLKAAILQSDNDFVEKTLETFGLNRQYFENPNNWVSIEFFENFLDALSRRMDLNDLSILAGEIAMRKELVGPGYYVLKWFGNVSFFIGQIKKTTEKLNTNRYVTVEKISDNSIIVSFHLKDGYRLPKHRSTDLNFQTLLHHGVCLAQNLKRSDVIVDQIASAYDSKGASRFKVTWKQRSSWLKYVAYLCYAGVNTFAFNEFPEWRQEILGSNLVLLFLRNTANKFSFNKALKEIDSFYTDVEENAKKQYDNLFQAKKNLESHHNRLEVINGISSEIHMSKSIPSILETTSKLICEQFNFSRCMIMLRDPDGFLRTHAVYSHEELPFLKMLWGFEVDLTQKRIQKKVVSTAYHSRQTVLVRDVTKTLEDLTDFSKEMIGQLKTKAYVISPICTEDEIHGVVIADKGRENIHEISQLEVQTLEEISVTLAIAISKQKRYDDLNETLTVLKRYNPKVFANNQIDQNKVSLAGSRKEVVSGFLDVRGFTNISDKYPPEVIIDIINHLAVLCEDSLNPEVGHIDKFIGDEFFFTWENQEPEVLAQSAFKTVLQIQNKLELLNEEALKKNFPEIKVGIGLDVGPVIRGNIGTEKRMDYTSIGSSVNKAARLQSLNKEYSSTLIISEQIYQYLNSEDQKYFTEQKVSIRGFDQAESVYIFRGSNG